MKTVILAGGKGTRLKPYTTVLPKPLMPIGNKPILEIIIGQLKSCGLNDIIITLGHLGEMITNFFGDGKKLGVNINYLTEEKPLGTTGGLGMLKDELEDTFLVINGDTLTSLDYGELVDYHRKNGASATIALMKRDVYIDFGIVDVDAGNNVRGYTEKPTIEHLVSMGVNVFEPGVLKYVKTGEYLDFPDLVRALIADGNNVKGFLFDGYWLDIGRRDDYEKASEEIEEIGKILNL
jgi:NDP-sugar pyrophosphorylase family protein